MSDSLKTQYRVLAELRRVDDKILRIQVDLAKVPDEITTLEAALLSRKADFDQIKQNLDTEEKSLRKAEQDLKDREDKLHKAEGKMMEVKTNEEYQAAMKENQAQKTEKGSLEEIVLSLLTKLDEKRAKFKDLEKDFKAYEGVIKDDKNRLESERLKLVNLLETHIQERNQIAQGLESSTSALYMRLAIRGKGGAIALIENGRCLSCNMQVRPQLYNEIIGYKCIHSCPSCGRILVTSLNDESQAAAE